MASASANMGFPRVDMNDSESAALGGLIDVRPKKLHHM